MDDTKATFAIYRDQEQIRNAVRSLKRLGFQNTDFFVFSPKEGEKDFPQVQKNQVRSGAVVGSAFGVMVALMFYLFSGVGRTGLVASALGGIWLIFGLLLLGGALGAACGSLVGIGTPFPMAQRYAQYLQSGGILLWVRGETPADISRAQKVLAATGGQDIHRADEKSTLEKTVLPKIQSPNRKLENILHAKE